MQPRQGPQARSDRHSDALTGRRLRPRPTDRGEVGSNVRPPASSSSAAATCQRSGRWIRQLCISSAALGTAALSACAPDPPDTVAAARRQLVPIAVGAHAEARRHNDGEVYEFVADASGYVITPAELPAGEVTLTLTYVGERPAPHSLVFEGINDDQPVVAVDFPGSNNGTVVLPPGGARFYDGAPGNRDKGFEGELSVVGNADPAAVDSTPPTLTWTTTGSTFTRAPSAIAPANVALNLELAVSDRLPHSIALEGVRDGQPLVAVDGPGTNRRTLELPAGTYIYYCAVPGHREAGMEGLITFD